ncbi:MAG TPA: ATP-binding cassette domain-containing protein [Bacteroidales bacterium]|jgi:ABC-type multidrug transport system ATPase subunit|nr:ATP-binding cassette domain-containing protein [Bacteroidales bacterium]
MQNCLEADSIRKSFGDKQVLTDIFIRCCTGDIIGLLGLNGSGKSTLLKILFGTLSTDYKHIAINGEHLDQPYKKKGAAGFLNQDNFLPKSFTVRRILRMFDCRVQDPEFYNDEVLSKVYDTRVGNLSGGESRYLEVKLILNLNKKFVLLDEPFNGISPIHIDLIKEMIRKHAGNKGIILTDHDYRNVLDVANKYMILYDGGIKILKSKEDFIYWGYLPGNK